MAEYVILLSIPGLRGKDLMRHAQPQCPGGRSNCVGAKFSLRHLSGASQHDDRRNASRTWRGGQRFLLARTARNRNVDRLERLHPRAADLGCVTHAKARRDFRRVVSHAQQGLRGRLHLYAGANPQSRRLRVALVLHEADGTVWRAARSVWAFSAAALLGADGQYQEQRVDRRFGHRGRAPLPTQFFLHLFDASRLRGAKDWPR